MNPSQNGKGMKTRKKQRTGGEVKRGLEPSHEVTFNEKDERQPGKTRAQAGEYAQQSKTEKKKKDSASQATVKSTTRPLSHCYTKSRNRPR